ncbi:hypothetical protein [Paenibacillus sp. YYML68]|uniref:hypothetical protein n=1 Tax=Paenibacillus sp. YYML68 TaxID=2909250 RepID=UPI002491EF1F|nr:hypothetical protein [Paenibacillus sp. YYML68]
MHDTKYRKLALTRWEQERTKAQQELSESSRRRLELLFDMKDSILHMLNSLSMKRKQPKS